MFASRQQRATAVRTPVISLWLPAQKSAAPLWIRVIGLIPATTRPGQQNVVVTLRTVDRQVGAV